MEVVVPILLLILLEDFLESVLVLSKKAEAEVVRIGENHDLSWELEPFSLLMVGRSEDDAAST